MARKSDKGRKAGHHPRRVSATEASRSFARILDQIESGAQVLIRRHGKDVCLMSPPPFRGRTAAQCLDVLRGRVPVQLDGRFGNDLLAIIASEPVEAPPWDC